MLLVKMKRESQLGSQTGYLQQIPGSWRMVTNPDDATLYENFLELLTVIKDFSFKGYDIQMVEQDDVN